MGLGINSGKRGTRFVLGVTGPDDIYRFVNNNYYTNRMVKTI